MNAGKKILIGFAVLVGIVILFGAIGTASQDKPRPADDICTSGYDALDTDTRFECAKKRQMVQRGGAGMLVDELIEELNPYRGRSLNVVIIDDGDAVISDDVDITISPDYVLEYKNGSKCISAVIADGAKVLGKAIGIIAKGYYKEEEE